MLCCYRSWPRFVTCLAPRLSVFMMTIMYTGAVGWQGCSTPIDGGVGRNPGAKSRDAALPRLQDTKLKDLVSL